MDFYIKRIHEVDKYNIIVQDDMLPHEKSIQIVIKSNVMVMYGEHGEKGELNYLGKFYEYLRIGKPIPCFSTVGSYQDEILRKTEMRVNMDLYDFEGIEEFLKKQIIVWRENKKIKVGVEKNIQKYERRNLTKN